MRSFLLSVCLFLLLPIPALSQARSGSAATNTSNATPFTLSFAPTAGRFAVCNIDAPNGQTITSLADNINGTTDWSVAFNSGRHAMFYNKSAASGITTLTITTSASGGVIICQAYTGMATVSPLDQVSTTNTSTGTTQTSNMVTTTQAAELMIGFLYQTTSTADFSAGGSWAVVLNGDFSSQAENLGMLDQVVAATGTYQTQGTTVGSVTWFANIATFKASAAGGTCNGGIPLLGVGKC